MISITSYRYAATGIWGYAFYRGMKQVGSVTSNAMPSSVVRMIGDAGEWYSGFSIDTPMVPGVSRKVKDNRTGEELYRIVFWKPDLYEFTAKAPDGTWSLVAEQKNGVCLFGGYGKPVIAVMERIVQAEEIPLLNGGLKAEPCFRTTFQEEPSEGMMMMILSFPALKIT